jgi:hypothetical protein
MKNLKQTVATILIGISSLTGVAQTSMGALKGKVLNNDHLPVIGAVIRILQDGVLIGGATTDADGYYTYKPLNSGSYDVILSSSEIQTKKITNVMVGSEKTTYLDIAASENTLDEMVIVAYSKPIIDKTFMDIKEITAEDFITMAVDRGNIVDAIVTVSSETTKDANGDVHVRGGRGGATAFIVDGVKSPGITGVAALSVRDISIITGGIPAQYGDNTSGVIVVNTKDYFSAIQSKRMRQNATQERIEKEKREKEAILNEKKRKEEIEEELRLEKINAESKG